MTKEQAINEAARLKQYFPFRICGIIETCSGIWEAQARKTMSAFNTAARKGLRVEILTFK